MKVVERKKPYEWELLGLPKLCPVVWRKGGGFLAS
jgi:hypothetical protein